MFQLESLYHFMFRCAIIVYLPYLPHDSTFFLCCEFCRTFTLKRGTIGSSGTASTGGSDEALLLPLWGQICCCLIAQPECATQHRISGFINMQVGNIHTPSHKRTHKTNTHISSPECTRTISRTNHHTLAVFHGENVQNNLKFFLYFPLL